MNRREFLRRSVYLGCALGLPVSLGGDPDFDVDAAEGIIMGLDPASGYCEVHSVVFRPGLPARVGDYWMFDGQQMEVTVAEEAQTALRPVGRDDAPTAIVEVLS